MRIGIDFDNTIVDYSKVFSLISSELGWLPKSTLNKSEIKALIINTYNERKWTELQGHVYGDYIHLATPYKSSLDVVKKLISDGHDIFIVSHKTRYPVIGDKVSLHDSARNWLKDNAFSPELISFDNVSFHATRDEKIKKIESLSLDFFIDDLEEVLLDDNWPSDTLAIHFSPYSKGSSNLKKINNWMSFMGFLKDV